MVQIKPLNQIATFDVDEAYDSTFSEDSDEFWGFDLERHISGVSAISSLLFWSGGDASVAVNSVGFGRIKQHNLGLDIFISF